MLVVAMEDSVFGGSDAFFSVVFLWRHWSSLINLS